MIKKSLNYLFYILVLLAMIICVDPDTLVDTPNVNIIVPYLPVKVSVAVFGLTLFGLALTLTNKKIKVDIILLLLGLRLLLYLIPAAYVQESYSIGTTLAVLQCLFLYFIGLNFKGSYNILIKIMIIFSLIIIGEELYVLFYRNLSFSSPELKHFMVLPLGRYNYLTCFLLPIYFMVDNYYKGKKNLPLKILYTVIVLIGILATGSKLALLLFILYFLFKFLKIVLHFKFSKDNLIYVSCGLLTLLIISVLGFFNLFEDFSVLHKFFQFSTYEPRLKVYHEGVLLFMEHPFLGRGAAPYQIYDAVSAHNIILEALIQTGIIGTVIYLLCLCVVLKNILRIKDTGFKAVALVFYFSVLIQGMAEPALFGLCFDTFFWFLIGYFVQQSKRKIVNHADLF